MTENKISIDEPPPAMPVFAEWLRMSESERRALAKEYLEWRERGGHRTNITAESVKQFLAERERQAKLARQHQAQRTPENREWERDRIAQEEKAGLHPGRHWDGKRWRGPDGKALRSHAGLPEPSAGYDPTRYDPAHPHYDYDAANYDPADYEAWKQSRIAYLRKQQPNTPANPFGPDGSTAVHGQITSKNWVKVAYQNVIHFFHPGNDR